MNDERYEPDAHYDRVTAAWAMLLGEELHYGVFDDPDSPLPRATQRLTDLMTIAAALRPGLSVLDVGCGSGAPACDLVERADVRVTGITTSELGVDAARARAQSRSLFRCAQFMVADGTANGFPAATFDRVWVLESSHLMRDKAALIRECARVLRPGGRLVLCDIIRKRDIPFREVQARRADFVTLRTAFGDAHMQRLETYVDLLNSQGLECDEVTDLTEQTLLTFARWRENASHHRDAVTSALGDDGFAAFVRSTHILEEFWRDGTLGYGLISAAKTAQL